MLSASVIKPRTPKCFWVREVGVKGSLLKSLLADQLKLVPTRLNELQLTAKN